MGLSKGHAIPEVFTSNDNRQNEANGGNVTVQLFASNYAMSRIIDDLTGATQPPS